MLRDFFLGSTGTLSKQQMANSKLSSVSGLRQRYVYAQRSARQCACAEEDPEDWSC